MFHRSLLRAGPTPVVEQAQKELARKWMAIANGKVTHAALAEILENIGAVAISAKASKYSKSIFVARDGQQHGPVPYDVVDAWRNREQAAMKRGSVAFGVSHRGADKGQDEIFSTSTYRELFGGATSVISRRDMSEDQRISFDVLMDIAAKLRVPTPYVGFSVGGGKRMQHPATGIWGRSRGILKRYHDQLDLRRRLAACEAMVKAALEPNPSMERILLRGIYVAGCFTLNHMMAPSAARNMTLSKKTSQAKIDDQMQVRENLKEVIQDIGKRLGRSDPNSGHTQAHDSPWVSSLALEKVVTMNSKVVNKPPSPRRKLSGSPKVTRNMSLQPVIFKSGPKRKSSRTKLKFRKKYSMTTRM